MIASVLAQHEGHAAMVANHVFFKPRMAIRETAKVFGLPDGEIAKVVSRLPWFWRSESEGANIRSQLEGLTEMKGVRFDDPWPEILRIAQQLIGAPRYLSVHPGGTVLTPRPNVNAGVKVTHPWP